MGLRLSGKIHLVLINFKLELQKNKDINESGPKPSIMRIVPVIWSELNSFKKNDLTGIKKNKIINSK